MGLRPTQGDEKTGPVQQLLLLEAPPSPLSSRPEESWVVDPPKGMKNGSCSATTVAGSAALPFVISTGAQRSGEICGVSGPFLGMFFDRAYPDFLLRDVHVCASP
jgi:hypothetical protein